MNGFLTSLNRIDFLALIWLFPLALTLHEAEEWNILGWYHRNFVNLPAKTNISIRTFLVFASILGFVWCALAVLPGNPAVAAFVVLPLAIVILQNCFQHLYWLVYFKQYAPGVITAVLLLIPLISYLIARAVQQNYVPVWYVVVLAVLMIPGLLQTVKARNTLTPQFRAIHHFGIALSRWLGLAIIE